MDLAKDLTKRQAEIVDFIKRHLERTGYPPTVREIGKALGLHSPSTVHAHLSKLEKLGMLRRDPTKPRAIELLADRARRAMGKTPVVGNVAAGQPILAEENIEDYVEIPSMIAGNGDEFILRVRGDSMRDAGILEGDYVVVKPAEEAANGEIVVALIEDEATVKRYFKDRKQIRLEAENPAYEPIRTTDASIVGKVVGVFRSVGAR